MPKRSNAFQRLIASIETQLAPAGAKVTESVMLNTRDGTAQREVDVLIEGALGGHKVCLAVECRDHKRLQPVTWIDELQGKYSNLPVDKVIAVSRSGFSRVAQKRAARLGISTYTLKEALQEDWPQQFTKWRAGLIVLTAYVNEVDVTYDGGQPPPINGDELRATRIEGPNGEEPATVEDDALKLYTANGEQALKEAASKHMNEWWKDGPDKEQDIGVPFTAHNRFLVASNGARYRVQQVTLKLKCKFSLIPAQHRHFTYGDVRVTTAELPYDEGRTARFTMVHDDAGPPRAVTIRIAPPDQP